MFSGSDEGRRENIARCFRDLTKEEEKISPDVFGI
jgi:hypothetical protein